MALWREPIFKPGGLIIVGSLAVSLAIIVIASSGVQTSFLGALGVIIATHVVSGVARVLLGVAGRNI
jgi:hypothetical protein